MPPQRVIAVRVRARGARRQREALSRAVHGAQRPLMHGLKRLHRSDATHGVGAEERVCVRQGAGVCELDEPRGVVGRAGVGVERAHAGRVHAAHGRACDEGGLNGHVRRESRVGADFLVAGRADAAVLVAVPDEVGREVGAWTGWSGRLAHRGREAGPEPGVDRFGKPQYVGAKVGRRGVEGAEVGGGGGGRCDGIGGGSGCEKAVKAVRLDYAHIARRADVKIGEGTTACQGKPRPTGNALLCAWRGRHDGGGAAEEDVKVLPLEGHTQEDSYSDILRLACPPLLLVAAVDRGRPPEQRADEP